MSRRPDFNLALTALMTHVATTMREFRHIDPSRVLIIAGEARRASRGTVKPLCFSGKRSRDGAGRRKPVVKVAGTRMLYSITLRPLFFRRSTPRQRVATVLHELFHIAHEFDGTLDHKRRHAEAGEGFERDFGPIERKCWRSLPQSLIEAFSYDGEVRVLHWLERPQSWLPGERASQRTQYNEKHLFDGVVRMKTRPATAALSGGGSSAGATGSPKKSNPERMH